MHSHRKVKAVFVRHQGVNKPHGGWHEMVYIHAVQEKPPQEKKGLVECTNQPREVWCFLHLCCLKGGSIEENHLFNHTCVSSCMKISLYRSSGAEQRHLKDKENSLCTQIFIGCFHFIPREKAGCSTLFPAPVCLFLTCFLAAAVILSMRYFQLNVCAYCQTSTESQVSTHCLVSGLSNTRVKKFLFCSFNFLK